MSSQEEAIVIGSGIGGAAAGALLAHEGWKVRVLEKNNIIGGRCASYEKEGFIVKGFYGFMLLTDTLLKFLDPLFVCLITEF